MTRELWLFDDAPIVGGAEVFALRLGSFLAESGGPAMRVVCPAASELAERCTTAAIEYVPASFPPLGALGAPSWPRAVFRVRTLLREAAGAGAIAIGNTARAQAYIVAATQTMRREKPPIVQIVHERETLARFTGRLAYRHVGSPVAMGGRIASLCEEKLPGVEVRQANSFVDWHDFQRNAGEPASGEPVVGVLARFIPGKGQLDLVEELAEAGSWSRAVLAGPAEDEAYKERVKERIAELSLAERISVRGNVEDTDPFFAEIDALIVPSTGTEGQPMVIVEGLAQGRPALVRRLVFSPGDYDGLPVIPYQGAAELTQRLAELPRDPVPLEQLRHRFGPEQALEAILAAADEQTHTIRPS